MTLDTEDIHAIAREIARQLREEFNLPSPAASAAGLTPLREYQIRQMARDRIPKRRKNEHAR